MHLSNSFTEVDRPSLREGSTQQPSLRGHRKGHCQSDQQWNCFQGNAEKTSEMAFSAYGLSTPVGTNLITLTPCIFQLVLQTVCGLLIN